MEEKEIEILVSEVLEIQIERLNLSSYHKFSIIPTSI